MKKRIVSLLLASALAVMAIAGCGSKKEAAPQTEAQTEAATQVADGKTYKIGVLQLVEHPALDATNKGFVAALDAAGIKYEIDQQNAQNDQSACATIATKLVNDKDDLIFAIATPAAQAVAAETKDILIIVSAVTDPADAGLVDKNDAPNTNVSGTSDLTPVKEQIELMKKLLPDTKTVGILYCSAESNSEFQAKMAEEEIKANGMTPVNYTVSSSNEIQQVVESMVGKVDCIYAPTDNTIAAGMTTVSMVATENKIPVICGEEGMVESGGLATYGIDYYQLGYMAGEMAVKVLKGEDVSKMPIGYLSAEKCALSTNEEVAKKLGVDLSKAK